MIGQVGGSTVITVNDLVLDTAIYATGDVLADIFVITGAIRPGAGTSTITDITVIDKDNQSQPFDLVFFDRTFTLTGAKNAAWAVSDADIVNCLGVASITAGDYIALSTNSVAQKNNINITVNSQTKDIYVGTISRGTGTYTAGGLRVRVKISQD